MSIDLESTEQPFHWLDSVFVSPCSERHDALERAPHLTPRRGDLHDGLVYDAVRVRLIEVGEAVKSIDPTLGEALPACASDDIQVFVPGTGLGVVDPIDGSSGRKWERAC